MKSYFLFEQALYLVFSKTATISAKKFRNSFEYCKLSSLEYWSMGSLWMGMRAKDKYAK